MELFELPAQFGTQFGIQVGKRLVEQEYSGLAHERPPDGDTLTLPTGKIGWLALQQLGQVQHAGRSRHSCRDFRLRDTGDAWPEGHVSFDGHRRVQRVRLKHHADAAVFRVGPGHVVPTD